MLPRTHGGFPVFLIPSERRKTSPPAILAWLLAMKDDGVGCKPARRTWRINDIAARSSHWQVYLSELVSETYLAGVGK